MQWTGLFAVMALLVAQLAIAGLSLYAYNRIRGKEDAVGQEKINWGFKVEAAVNTADSARRMVETMEVEHFKRLRALFEVQAGELAEARARITSLEKELKVCQMKLASEERIERRITQAKAKRNGEDVDEGEPAAAAADPSNAAQLELEDIIRAHGLPLTQPPASGPARPPSFGKVMKGR